MYSKLVKGVEVVELRPTKREHWKIYLNRASSLILRVTLALALFACPFQPRDDQNRFAWFALIFGTLVFFWMIYFIWTDKDRPVNA